MAWYPHRRGPLALELASTIFALDGQPRDALATPDDLADWLSTNGQHVPPHTRGGTHHLEAFRTLRSAVRELLSAAVEDRSPPDCAVALVNELSAAAPRWTRLEWADPPRCRAVEVAADPATVSLAIVARATIDLLSSAERQRLERCRAPGCVLFFLKERRRREWCSAQCGNRARVARHYARHRR